MYRDGKILWHCGLSVPPGEEGDITLDFIKKSIISFIVLSRSKPAQNGGLFEQGELSSLSDLEYGLAGRRRGAYHVRDSPFNLSLYFSWLQSLLPLRIDNPSVDEQDSAV